MKRTLTYPGITPCVMLTHNALPLTQAAVKSVLEQDTPVQLRVVDNGSTDGTWDWLQTQSCMKWQFFPPLGVSAGWNFALTDVFRHFDHAVVINNDVQLLPSTVRVLTADPGEFVTAVSVGDPAQLNWDGVIRKRPHPDFSCFMIRRSCWQKVGGFDESTVLMAILPLAHNYNLASPGMLGAFYYGGTVVLAPSGEATRRKAPRFSLSAKLFCS